MKCPYCNEEDTRVIDSRPADDGSSIRRRRQCDACGKRFTTYEKVETIPIMIIKKDKQRASYYNYYSTKKWGKAETYNLCVDSTVLGRDGTVELLYQFVMDYENMIANK